jgi:hypothetical protein
MKLVRAITNGAMQEGRSLGFSKGHNLKIQNVPAVMRASGIGKGQYTPGNMMKWAHSWITHVSNLADEALPPGHDWATVREALRKVGGVGIVYANDGQPVASKVLVDGRGPGLARIWILTDARGIRHLHEIPHIKNAARAGAFWEGARTIQLQEHP